MKPLFLFYVAEEQRSAYRSIWRWVLFPMHGRREPLEHWSGGEKNNHQFLFIAVDRCPSLAFVLPLGG